jgi:hypothetical protein
MDAVGFGGIGLIKQVQLGSLLGLQQRDHYVDTVPPPASGFALQPVAASWPGDD